MKPFLLAAALLLSGCALAGWEGPERQRIAQESLRKLPGELDKLGRATIEVVADALPHGGGGYSSTYQADCESRRARWDAWDIEDKLDQANRNQRDIEDKLNRLEWQHNFERIQQGLVP